MVDELKEKLESRICKIYQEKDKQQNALEEIEKVLKKHSVSKDLRPSFSQHNSILITYGDTIRDGERNGIEVLNNFLNTFVKDAVDTVHLLPMFPFTSDDGFSVSDYREINRDLGTWDDIHKLSENYGLMFDAVINHASKSCEWFQKYLANESPYHDYFITCAPEEDYSKVVRPRALPLLTKFETSEGGRYVWTTFSEDQVDLNFGSPRLLAEIIDILIFYAENGARYIRLDAVGFLWKELGTSCMHLPQTHEIIKLTKDILEYYAPDTRIITETNVPHKDNISYFGKDGDEADLVYQFPLPPFVMFSLLTGNASKMADWLEGLTLPSERVTYFNFLSSHDGIGVRPVEGVLTEEERETLITAALRNGGEVSYKDNGDGTKSPYELNINFQDALSSPDERDADRIAKFLAAQTILLSLQGIPGIYIHSLLGSRNDYFGKTTSGIPRRINREKLDLSYIKEQLEGETNRKIIFEEIMRRLELRKMEEAFSPLAAQDVLRFDERVLSFKRVNKETKSQVLVLINVSGEHILFANKEFTGVNILNGNRLDGSVELNPWECAWIKNH